MAARLPTSQPEKEDEPITAAWLPTESKTVRFSPPKEPVTRLKIKPKRAITTSSDVPVAACLPSEAPVVVTGRAAPVVVSAAVLPPKKFEPYIFIRGQKWFRLMVRSHTPLPTITSSDEKGKDMPLHGGKDMPLPDAVAVEVVHGPKRTPCLFDEVSREKALDKLIIAYVDVQAVYWFTVFDSFLQFNDYQQTFDPVNRTFFEVILGERGQKPHFDIDIKKENLVEGHTLQQAGIIVLDQLVGSLLEIYPELDLVRDILIYASSDQTKVSYHVVVNNYYHINNYEAKALYYEVIKRYPDNVPYVERIDMAVYSSAQQFRVLGSRKRGTQRPKVFQRDWVFRGQNIHHEYFEEPTDSGYEALLQLKEALVTFTGESKMLPFLLEDSQTGAPRRYGEDRPDDLSAELAHKAFHLLSVVAKIPLTSPSFPFRFDRVVGNEVRMKRLHPSMCSICRRIHENDNPRLLVLGHGVERTVLYDCRRDAGGHKRNLGVILDDVAMQEVQAAQVQTEEWAATLCSDVIGALEKISGETSTPIDSQTSLDEAMARVTGRMAWGNDLAPKNMPIKIRIRPETVMDKVTEKMEWEVGETKLRRREAPQDEPETFLTKLAEKMPWDLGEIKIRGKAPVKSTLETPMDRVTNKMKW